jgi:hemerythrin-like domain-containing protein
MTTDYYYESFGYLVTGIVFGLSVLRLLVMVYPQVVILLLGLKTLGWSYNGAETVSEQTEQAIPVPTLKADPDKPWTLFKLQGFREELETRFARHQELLLQGNIKKALSSLEFFVQQLSIHITEENEIIIPLFKKNAPFSDKEKEQVVNLYAGEHKKFLSLLQEAVDRLREMQMSFVTKKSADILYILELEMRFKGMLHKHDTREFNDLYLGAEYGLSEDERRSVWDKCARKREELGYRLGRMTDLTPQKLSMVRQNWMIHKDLFPEAIAKVAQENDKQLPISEASTQEVQGLSPGYAEAHFINDVVQALEYLDKDTVAYFRSRLPASQVDACDDFIGLVLQAQERLQSGGWSGHMKEAWANSLNAALNSYNEDNAFM